MNIADFLTISRSPEGGSEIALTAVGAAHFIEDFQSMSPDPIWTISPKTYNQLLRLAARGRRQHRAWLRKKRQRRAQQRRHYRGGQ